MMSLKINLGVVALAVFGLGCAESEDVDTNTPRNSGGKTQWSCRTCDYYNSPTAGLDPLGSFFVGNDPSRMSLRSIRLADGTELVPSVAGGKLSGSDAKGTHEGSALVGGSLVFGSPLGYQFDVEIYSYQPHGDWVTGHDVHTYGLAHDDNGETLSICPGFNLDETSVVVMPGELYDDQNKLVQPSPGMASLACRGHAVAKMKMMGYAPGDDYGSDATERQATFKMLTADYCGTGLSFTQVGTPLNWSDITGNFPAPPANAVLEAKWTAAGASCLDQPRLVSREDVTHHCPALAKCLGDLSFGSNHWISTNR